MTQTVYRLNCTSKVYSKDFLGLKIFRRKARNQLAHDYDGEYAKKIFDLVNQKFYKCFEKFKNDVAVYYTYDWNENVKFWVDYILDSPCVNGTLE